MSLIDRAFGELRNVDVAKSIRINLLRWMASGWVVAALLLLMAEGAPGSLLVSMPFAMGMAFGFGVVARALSKIGVPFAGLFEMLMRLSLMSGDWVLHLFLEYCGEWVGLPYRFGWFNFSLALFVDREGQVQVEGDVAKAVLKQAMAKRREAEGNVARGEDIGT